MSEDKRSEQRDQQPQIVVTSPGEPPPPGTDEVFRLDLEEARESEDYHAIYGDLDLVVNMTRYIRGALLRQSPKPSGASSPLSTSEMVLNGLWVAALVTYGRCFHKGKRRWLGERIFEGEKEDILVWHRYFRDTRDKHIAHSVNPFEIHATGVHISDHDGDDPRVESVVTMHATRAGEPPDVVGYLEWLATYARDYVWKKHNEASRKVFNKAKSLSKEQLRKLRPLQVMLQQSFEAAKARRR